ncbi:hypothetical protein, partial [Klebsiella pneumoniae]|uniref:hypothetical protein n=1 Tax=Klebsiella pneumoniae TaxID=573 RepID=UPI001F4A8B27
KKMFVILKRGVWRVFGAGQKPFFGGGMEYFQKKKHFILGGGLGAGGGFLQEAPGGAARGVCSDM